MYNNLFINCPYYIDNISQEIIKIKKTIDKFETIYYVFPNDISNILKINPNYFLKKYGKIKFFEVNNYLDFTQEYLEFISNNKKSDQIIQTPLMINGDLLFNIVDTENYYINNFFPFMLTVNHNENKTENKEFVKIFMKDYFIKLNQLNTYIDKNVFYGTDYNLYIKLYEEEIKKYKLND
jgi:hypothetical protein